MLKKTCYMNTILQYIRSAISLQTYFLVSSYKSTFKKVVAKGSIQVERRNMETCHKTIK